MNKELIQNLIDSRFPSILVEGIEHKESLNRLARHLLCETQTLCEVCLSCKWSSKSQHPDWLQVDHDLKMDALRDLLYEFRLKPSRASERILSISNFQDSNLSVQNALLKTLEEPLQNRRILLGVSHSKSVVATVRSRCLRVASGSTPPESFEEWEDLFVAIERGFELDINKNIDSLLKNREETQRAFKDLAWMASQRRWPGRWRKLAPYWEDAREALDRNLNPRIVWDKILENQNA